MIELRNIENSGLIKSILGSEEIAVNEILGIRIIDENPSHGISPRVLIDKKAGDTICVNFEQLSDAETYGNELKGLVG